MNGGQPGHLITRYTRFLTFDLTSFRQVPVFGETIRRFDDDVSEMKRLAGHDLEDLLQVSWCSCFGTTADV